MLDLGTEARMRERVEVAAYYVLSEALTNVAKHAHASVVHVGVDMVDGNLCVFIRDDGAGGMRRKRFRLPVEEPFAGRVIPSAC